MTSDLKLRDNDRVAIIGAGPAGSLFGYTLLRLARRAKLKLRVTLYDPRDFTKPGPAGCSGCVGVINGSLWQRLQRIGIEGEGAYDVCDNRSKGLFSELVFPSGNEGRKLPQLSGAFQVSAAPHHMFGGVTEGLVEVVQMICFRFQSVSLTGNDIEANVLQRIHKGGGPGYMPYHGIAVAVSAHIEKTENPASIGEVDLAFSQPYVVSAVSRIKGEAGWSAFEDSVQPVAFKAHILSVIVDLGARCFEDIKGATVVDSKTDFLQYAASCLVDLLQVFACKRSI